jgi:hypothetical protein
MTKIATVIMGIYFCQVFHLLELKNEAKQVWCAVVMRILHQIVLLLRRPMMNFEAQNRST